MWQVIISLLLAQGWLANAVTLVARISSGGIKGDITFTQNNSGGIVAVQVNLAGINSTTEWQLRTFRLNYDVIDRCSNAQLGPRILNSTITGRPENNTAVSGLELMGINAIEGRSIALVNSGENNPFACASIERVEDYVTASATFRQGIQGQVVFRQAASAPADSTTRIDVDLYSNTPQVVNWRVIEAVGCSSAAMTYNPLLSTGTCNSTNQKSCAIGDLTGKLGTVTVGVANGTNRATWIDLNLPLSQINAVVGKTLQFLTSNNTAIACAVIHEFDPRTGIAVFDNDGVTGNISMTQRSPLDPTVTQVNLKNLRSLAGGYHVHSWPVPQRVVQNQSLCGAEWVSGHLNPFNINYTLGQPAAGNTTEDMYEMGDLSGKYGMMNGMDQLSVEHVDFNLPLFGLHSILGRSLVIHRNDASGSRWICTNIRDTSAVSYALAIFTYPVIGHVLFQQRVGENYSETSVYVRLDYGTGNATATCAHALSVHEMPVGDDMVASDVSKRCASAGNVFHPLTSNASDYQECRNGTDPMRCMVGVSVRKGSATPAVTFFNDINLSLDGAQSVVGKSLVLKAANCGDQVLACATIYKVWPRRAKASDWGSTPTGYISFTQQVGVVQEPTTIEVNLNSLPDGSFRYHVNNHQVGPQETRCIDLGGTFNPFNVPVSAVSGGTKDQQPVGDLSGKFAVLRGPGSNQTVLDSSLNLWGPRSVVGRALGISNASDANIACADVVDETTQGGMTFKAKATFTGDVRGEIMLTQTVYPNGAMMPTTIMVNLRTANDTKTVRHNWHTHEFYVGDDNMASVERCASTGGHYNPFQVNMTSNYEECGISNPLRCELGDQSGKVGIYDLGSGPVVVSDVYLPLYGKYGVIGRSMVVHTQNQGASRLDCADILPADNTFSFIMTMATPTVLNKTDVINKFATATSSSAYNFAIQVINKDNGKGCTNLRVYFLGVDREITRQKFDKVIGGDQSVLGLYKPVTCSAAMTTTSLLLLLTAFFIGLSL